ncbi:MAG: ABC transporter permease [Cyclobacteriaceae bacterium]
MTTGPPKWANRLLEWYCKPELLEDLQGDLYEIYYQQLESRGVQFAKWSFIWLVLRSFRLSTLKGQKLKLNNNMTVLNLKVAARILKRERLNTSLNVLGLSVGIICFVLIGLYSWQELTYDQFHSKKERLFRVWLYENYGDDREFFNATTPLRFEELLETEFAEVQTATQYIRQQVEVIRADQERIDESIAVVSPEFFDVFDFELIHGAINNPFASDFQLVISRTYAKKYFGDADPVGRSLELQLGSSAKQFNVVAVMEDFPVSSSIQADLVVSNHLNRELFGDGNMQAWWSVVGETYLLLKENTAIASVEEKHQDVVMKYLDGEVKRGEYQLGFQPITDIHTNPDIPLGNAPVINPQYVYVLLVIGILVLLVACVNYATLSIGQSLKRTKEVGMRKILGANRNGLISQYLMESILVALMSMAIGGTFTIFLVPVFNELTGANLIYQFEWVHLLGFLALAVVVGLISGLYPVLSLSKIRTMQITNGGNHAKAKHWTGRALVVFQFLITIFLISSALIMRKQLMYLQEKDLGYNHEAFVSVALHADQDAEGFREQLNSSHDNAQLLRNRLEQHPQISAMSISSHAFGTNGWVEFGFEDKQGTFRKFRFLKTDADFFQAFGIETVQGRPLIEDGDDRSLILNRAAVTYFGLEEPIGAKLPGEEFGDHMIVGVTDDFHFSSLHTEVEPLVIGKSFDLIFEGISDADFQDSVFPKLIFKYTGNNLAEVKEILRASWETLFPNQQLTFSFVDESIRQQYEDESRMQKLLTVATIISIVIASIGLLGLTMLVMHAKEKEIGIRKVVGATTTQMFGLLSKSFASQLVMGIAFSVPFTVWLMRKWLDNFAFQVEIGVGVFVLAGFISIGLALLVISYHTWRASTRNPIKSLRTE